MKVVRRRWHDPQLGSVAPADIIVDSDEHTVSVGVREMACRLNNDGNGFDRAAENLLRTAQVKMSGEQLRKIVQAEGRRVLEMQRRDEIPTAFRAADCEVPADESGSQSDGGAQACNAVRHTRIYVGCDGVMVPLVTDAEKVKRRKNVKRKRQRLASSGKTCRPLPPRTRGSDLPYKEFKVIAFYDETGEHWHETLLREKRNRVGGSIRREAKRLGFEHADDKVANVDGANWIRQQLQTGPDGALPLDGLGLDFWHLSQNVQKAKRSVYGEGGEEDDEGKAWADGLMHTFKHEGYETARDQLYEWRRGLRGKKRKAADRLINDVVDRREMINDKEFREAGWQIGSGPTESRCRTSTDRLRGRGRRWNPRNATAVAALTTLKDSNQWHHYWPTPEPTTT